jgi:DNA processing protein
MHIRTDIVIKLLQLPKVGKKTVFKILDGVSFAITSDQDLVDVVKENAAKFKLPAYSQSEFQKAIQEAETILEKSERENINIISWYHKDYPDALKLVGQTQAPLILNIKGNIEALHHKLGVAVIGTRQPSDWGRKIGERLGNLFGQAEFNVVSGLAIGCDTAGHRGCLDIGGTTTAVLGEGLQKIYPKENKALAAEILEKGGVLVSEYFIGQTARPGNFVERDRIQAGLSTCVTVVETDIEGGTMHTVNYTLEYNRILAVYNHPIEKQTDKSRGNQKLLAKGKAVSLSNEADIRNLVERIQCTRPALPQSSPPHPGTNEPSNDKPQLKLSDEW